MKKESRKLEVFEYQLYGCYKSLISEKPLYKCISIGYSDDEEGYEWRAFCKDEYDGLKASGLTDQEIYDKFPTNTLI